MPALVVFPWRFCRRLTGRKFSKAAQPPLNRTAAKNVCPQCQWCERKLAKQPVHVCRGSVICPGHRVNSDGDNKTAAAKQFIAPKDAVLAFVWRLMARAAS